MFEGSGWTGQCTSPSWSTSGRPGSWSGPVPGNAVGAHQPVLERCGFGTTDLDRWLELWEETVDDPVPGPTAELAKQRARLAGQAIESLVRRHERAPVRSALGGTG